MGTLRPVRRVFVVATVALLAAAGVLAAAGPVAGSVRTETVTVRAPGADMQAYAAGVRSAYDAYFDRSLLVFGDSISARFNDVTGDQLQGFWSMLGDAVDAEPQLYAEGGAGFVNPGLKRCKGHTVRDQLADPWVQRLADRAGAVVVEAGRTDTLTCADGPGHRAIAHEELWWSADQFFAELSRIRGKGDPCTFVVVPWGPAGDLNRDRITGLVASVATSYGFTFVDTSGVLTEQNTIEDRIHPTVEGSHALADRVLSSGAAASCFA